MKPNKARAMLAEAKIVSNTHSGKQLKGMRAGYALAAQGNLELTQGTADLLAEVLADGKRIDWHLGRLVGFVSYHEELIRLLARTER